MEVCYMKIYDKKKFKKKKIYGLKDCTYTWLDELLYALILVSFVVIPTTVIFGLVKIAEWLVS